MDGQVQGAATQLISLAGTRSKLKETAHHLLLALEDCLAQRCHCLLLSSIRTGTPTHEQLDQATVLSQSGKAEGASAFTVQEIRFSSSVQKELSNGPVTSFNSLVKGPSPRTCADTKEKLDTL